jgi:hypothetical protein
VTPLEHELVELGSRLDHGDFQLDHGDFRPHVLRSMSHARRPAPRLLQVAAVFLIVLAAFVAAFAPARRAVARWFGIGVVEVRTSPTTLPLPTVTSTVPVVYSSVAAVTSVPSKPDTSGPETSAPDPLASARALLSFTPSLPRVDLAGPVQEVSVDSTIPGGLLIVRFQRFTLVEVGTSGDQIPVMTKIRGPGTDVEDVTVKGRPGLWLSGAPHQIAMIDRDGEFRLDTVRQEGNVLLWMIDDITFRVEGLADKASALTIAEGFG